VIRPEAVVVGTAVADRQAVEEVTTTEVAGTRAVEEAEEETPVVVAAVGLPRNHRTRGRSG